MMVFPSIPLGGVEGHTLRPFPVCRVLGYYGYPFCTPKSPRTTRSMTGSGYALADRRSREWKHPMDSLTDRGFSPATTTGAFEIVLSDPDLRA